MPCTFAGVTLSQGLTGAASVQADLQADLGGRGLLLGAPHRTSRVALSAALGTNTWSLGLDCTQNTCCWLLNSEGENVVPFLPRVSWNPVKSPTQSAAATQSLNLSFPSGQHELLLPPRSRPPLCSPPHWVLELGGCCSHLSLLVL